VVARVAWVVWQVAHEGTASAGSCAARSWQAVHVAWPDVAALVVSFVWHELQSAAASSGALACGWWQSVHFAVAWCGFA
jgi:hypothetical protein